MPELGLECQAPSIRADPLSAPAVAHYPEVVAAHTNVDCSAELHLAALLNELRLAGFDQELALATHDREAMLHAQHTWMSAAGHRAMVVWRLSACRY